MFQVIDSYMFKCLTISHQNLIRIPFSNPNMSCNSHFRNGRPCTYKAKRDGKCLVHWKDVPDCPICYSNDGTMVKLACNHLFHEDCIKQWLERNNLTCPICRGIVGPATLKRLGVKVDKRIEIISRIENLLFGNSFPMEDIGARFLRTYTVILHTFSQETSLRHNVIEYLQKRSKKRKEEVNELRDEVRQIKEWRNELLGIDPEDNYTEDKFMKLGEMHERIQRMLGWERL